MSRNETADLLDASRRVRAWLDSIELRASRRLRHLAGQGQAEAPDSMLTNVAGHSGRDARDVTMRDDLCGDHPEIEDALAVGDVTGRHLDAISAAVRNLPADVRDECLGHSDQLLARARHVSLQQFGRECRDLANHLLAVSRRGLNDGEELSAQRAASTIARWVDRSTGMHHTHVELDPVRDAKLSATMNRALARLRAEDGNARTPWRQMEVNAFVAAVTGDNGSVGEGTTVDPVGVRTVDRVPEITVLVDYDRLIADANDGAAGICETENGVPLPVSTVRRLCCDAEIIPVVLDGEGRVLDEGRSKRTATREQRRALRAMHSTCAHPACEVGFDACRVHHVVWWRNHGKTDIENLVPLCEQHHHLVHEGGWQLTMTADRVATWTRPDGAHHHSGTTISRTATAHCSTRRQSAIVGADVRQPMLVERFRG
jgi:hypothetical protein